jgi:hypothetical protein
MPLGLIDGPFVPHNLISTQESPDPLLKFQVTLRLKNLNVLWFQERIPDVLFLFSQKSRKTNALQFPNRIPMERDIRLHGILHISQNPHLSGSPVKEPSPKVPFMESLAERCPTTRALLHSSIKVPSIRAPPPPLPGSPRGERDPHGERCPYLQTF